MHFCNVGAELPSSFPPYWPIIVVRYLYLSLSVSNTASSGTKRSDWWDWGCEPFSLIKFVVWLWWLRPREAGRQAGNSPSSRQAELNNRLRLRQGLGGAGNTTGTYRRRPLNIIWSKILHWATGLTPALMKAVWLVIWIMRCSGYWKVQFFFFLKAS